MNRPGLIAFLRLHRLAVETSISAIGWPQAALVGYAVTDRLELIFDTLQQSRKAQNLRSNPHTAFVVGGWHSGDERTVQYEGMAHTVEAEEWDRLRPDYYAAWPEAESRANWPGLIYFCVRPTWIRYSDYNQRPPLIVEFGEAELATATVK